jgi:hypothetical protein
VTNGIAPLMPTEIKFFGRHGAIRDGILMAIDGSFAARGAAAWSCDSDEAVAAFDAAAHSDAAAIPRND